MLRANVNDNQKTIYKLDFVVLNCVVFLAFNSLPVYAQPNLIAEPNDTIEVDGASNPTVEPVAPAEMAVPEPMKTIDSETVEMTESDVPKTIEPKAIETTEPQNTEPSPVKVEPEMPEQARQPDVTNAGQPAKKDLGTKTVQFIEHLPKRLTLFGANVVVAAPVMFVRRSAQYTASDTQELIGDHKNPLLLIPAGTLSLYYGLMSAAVEAPVFGVTNSWKHSAEGTISKESLGLEESK